MGFLKKLLVLGVLAVGGLWFYGRSLPREHNVSASIILVAQVDTVFALMRNIGSTATWWDDVKSVRPLSGKPRESWEENMGSAGNVQIEVTAVSPGRRLVTTILNDDQQSFGGTWTHEVSSSASGTEVTVTEEGWVDPPLFRVFMKVRGAHRTTDSYLTSLGAHFGETVTPRHAR